MATEKQQRQEVLKKVAEYYRLTRKHHKFIPGQSYINYAGRVYDQKEMMSLVDSALDFWLTAGRYTREFEKRLAGSLGVKYCLSANSGSSANLLAISALTSPLLKGRQLRPGDEVITTACGFPTTLAPILQNNLVPVFVDIDLGSYNIQPEMIEKAVSEKTRAIFVAHTLGNPVDLGEIMKLVEKYRLFFIEDNCDSLGSKYRGKYTGTFGHISTCSFYPAHHITTGEGGAVLTDEPVFKKIIMSLRDWGRDCWCEPGESNTCGKRFSKKLGELPYGYDHKYIYSHIGFNLKITDMQAAIGCAQLDRLNDLIEARKKNWKTLKKGLAALENRLILPEATYDSDPSWFGFLLTVRENAGFNRDEIVRYLESKKIQTRMLFAGNIIKQPCFDQIRQDSKAYKVIGSLKNTETVMNNSFWIGVYKGINDEMIGYIISTIHEFLDSHHT